MTDVAKKSGVSRAAVSFVLNNRSRLDGTISEETRQRVLRAAAELDYKRNELARAVVTGKSRVLGLLTCDAMHEHRARIMAGMLEAAQERDYLVKVSIVPRDQEQHAAIARCVEWRLAGVMALNFWRESLEVLRAEMRRSAIPVAVVSDSAPMSWGVRVASDDALGVELAVQHLAELGHQRIALVVGPHDSPLSALREGFFRAAMGRRNLPVSDASVLHVAGWWGEEPTEAQIAALLTGADRPTALFCAGDPMAMVALRAARSVGLDVPRNLSVVGFADYAMAALATPPLSSVAQPFEEIGRRAVNRLVARIEQGEDDGFDFAQEELLAPRLVSRGSTAPRDISAA